MALDFSFACLDWEEKLKAGETPICALPIDTRKADQAEAIFNSLRLPDVIGQPTMAQAGGQWFRDIVRAAFGAYVEGTSERLIGELFVLVPKKNSKTTNSAALGITALVLNLVPNAVMLIVGPSLEVADTCFSQAIGMIEADETLKALFQVRGHIKTIEHRITGAVLKIKTFDMKVMTGAIPILVILDELHIMAKNHYAKKVLGQIRGGMITRPDTLLIMITTQSVDPPAGIFKSELEYARGVRDGLIKEEVRLLPILYEFSEAFQKDKRELWQDPKYWPMVLPNLGRSIEIHRLTPLFRQAMDKGLEDKILWASQHLNIQIGLGTHSDLWIGGEYWLSSEDENLTYEKIKEVCDVCVVGIDGGGLDDLLGLTVIGRHRTTKIWLSWSKAFADELVKERRKNIVAELEDFEKAGDLVFVSDGVEDISAVAEICADLNNAGLLPDENAIGLDPEGVAAIIDALIGAGISEAQLAAVSQGYKLNAAIKGAPRKLKNGSLKHCDQALMNWCVGNARAEMRGNAQIVTKQLSGSGKIDPLMAFFDAVMLMSQNPSPSMKANMDEFLSNPVMVI
ncbi:terminase large subunit [Falsihalocynthiibacter sp. BN13B15]|uniref:terminase large subunit n=1 Tax=Falsihalocynthiibacter sp. BN13B15 TaxID=3240871 RepID=UPI00350F1F0B